ncbi:ComEC/Rec2 family competence protein [Ferruginibacter profundus]
MAVSVNIKMYRIGELGDCFLLRFTSGSEITHVLIDCGSYWNNNSSIDRLKKIATDIKKQVAGQKLDVIVGTHQHNDHLSGFIHAKTIFNSIKPEQVWLSWLDDPSPDNKLGRKIGEDYNNYLTSLRNINKELSKDFFADADEKIKKSINGLLGFYGVGNNDKMNATTQKLPAELPARAREELQKMGRKAPQYLSPGEVFNLPGISNGAVKVYVLGPPKDEEHLYKKEPRKDETFDHKLASNGVNAEKMLSAMKKLTGTAKIKKDEEPFPFDEPYRKSDNFKAVEKAYDREKWRQIEADWINQAEQLALWLDGFTNNSSLVLAFEIVKTKKVLLFAADAQAGNWRSWKEIKWKKMPADFNWLTLMKNTVLYKTGHHGSHNSTLAEALNNMTHKELVVMIPVEKSDPMVNFGKGWQMPAINLYKELKKRSRNRIIRMDEGIAKAKEWDKLPHKPTVNDLYCEYEVKE